MTDTAATDPQLEQRTPLQLEAEARACIVAVARAAFHALDDGLALDETGTRTEIDESALCAALDRCDLLPEIPGPYVHHGHGRALILAGLIDESGELLAPLAIGAAPPAAAGVNYADADLLRRAVIGAPCDRTPAPRWSHVAARFGLGATLAAQLCERFGLDALEILPRADR